LTGARAVRYSRRLSYTLMSHRFTFFASRTYASFWWWYPTATEGAASV